MSSTTAGACSRSAVAFLLAAALGAQDPVGPGTTAAEHAHPTRDFRSPQSNGRALGEAGPFRLTGVSLDGLFAVGSSTERGDALARLQGGEHDPRTRGFTVQNVELSVFGEVDRHFTAEAHVVYFVDPAAGESEFELEEAVLTTTSLPAGLELRVGQIYTEFGIVNPQHPHQWDWLDQPIVHTRVFGPDGMRGPGARLSWRVPAPFEAELRAGAQSPNGEAMASFHANDELFLERPVGGRPFTDQDVRNLGDLVWLLGASGRWEPSDTTRVGVGVSFAFGPNATGSDARTRVYGADLYLAYVPEHEHEHESGSGSVAEPDAAGVGAASFQGEFVYRDYEAAAFVDPGDPSVIGDETAFAGDDLGDWGFYAQALYGIAPRWQAGLRYELVAGSGPSFDSGSTALVSRASDPFRDDRYRISPLLTWRPSAHSRLRLQYDYDRADHLLDDDAHSVWLGFEVAIGVGADHDHD